MTDTAAAAPAPAADTAAVAAPPVAAPAAPPASLIAPNEPAANDWLPEKYRVTKDDGSIDEAASSRKLAQGYGELVKRLGTDDKPPATPEEYKVEGLPDGFDFDAIKADPLYSGFLKSAHAKGMTNAQVSFVIGEYLARTPEIAGEAQRLSEEEATAELGKVWKGDGELTTNIAAANRAANAYASAGDEVGSMSRLMSKFGTDPDFLVFAARVGAEMQEDRSPGAATGGGAQGIDDQMNAIYSNPAYFDAKHPEHATLVQKMEALHRKKYPPQR